MHIAYDDLRRLCPRGDPAILAEIVRLAPELLPRYGITTPRRWCHLVAQLAHESAHFQTTVEYASGKAYDTGRLAQRLGNTPEADGDGQRYKGRGLIQLTGRDNYRRVGAELGAPLEDRPEMAAEFPVAFESGLIYWRDRKLNQYADQDDAEMITRAINGGTNGLTDRMRYLALAKRIWGAAAGPGEADANGIRPTLRRGAAGEAVRTLQQALNTPTVMREIDLRVFVDGQFGPGTEAALKAWQRIAGLKPDGICGPATWTSLDNLAQPVPDAAPPPKRPPPVDAPDQVEPEPAPLGGFFHAATAAFRRLFT